MKLSKRDVTEYWKDIQATAQQVADAVVYGIGLEEGELDEDQISELFTRELHENTGDHEWARYDEKACVVLFASKHACAEWDTGVEPRNASDSFPWSAFAGAAIEADVRDAALTLLKEKGVEIR